MKKITALLLVVFTVTTFLSGCSFRDFATGLYEGVEEHTKDLNPVEVLDELGL